MDGVQLPQGMVYRLILEVVFSEIHFKNPQFAE